MNAEMKRTLQLRNNNRGVVFLVVVVVGEKEWDGKSWHGGRGTLVRGGEGAAVRGAIIFGVAFEAVNTASVAVLGHSIWAAHRM